MSTAVLVVAPSAVAAAAAAAPVLDALDAAVLAADAALAATELGTAPVRRPADYGEQLDRAAGPGAWVPTAAHVVGLNARLLMFEARARRAGIQVTVPARLDLVGCAANRAAAWCQRTAGLLELAQLALHTELAERELATAAAALPGSGSTAARAEAMAVLGRYQRMLRNRYAASAVDPTVVVGPLDATVQRKLRQLDPDAHEGEHEQVLALAAAVAAHSTRPTEAHGLLRLLTETVATINTAVAGRRLLAEQSVALVLQTIALPQSPYTAVAVKLLSTATAETEPTEELHRTAKAAVAWSDGAARRAYIMTRIRTYLSGLGYVPHTNPDNADALEFSRFDWGELYRAQTWVDEQGCVHGRVIRENAAIGDRVTLVDAKRRAQFVRDVSLAAP